ncbi:MAG: hypothetical protein IKL67_03720 [Tidjanibacter sp.]|nr:hypothetical protein [Tidjanibacter sp.]
MALFRRHKKHESEAEQSPQVVFEVDTKPTGDTKPMGDTKPTGGTKPMRATMPMGATTSASDIKPTGAVKPDAKMAKSNRRKGAVKGVLSGEVLVSSPAKKHYIFALYCCLLIILYMGYVFSSQRLQREQIECRIELQKTRAKSLLYSSEKISASRHSNITSEVEKRGIEIKEWPTPPQVIGKDEAKKH